LFFINICIGVTSPLRKLSLGFNIRDTGIPSSSAICCAAASAKGFKSFKVMSLSKFISPVLIFSRIEETITFLFGFLRILKASTSISFTGVVSVSTSVSTIPSVISEVLKTTSPRSFALSYIISALLPSLPK